MGKTGQEPVLDQIRRRKWNWLGHILRRNDDNITKQALQGYRGRGRPRNTWKRDLEKEMYKYSWRKMEAAAQDRAGWRPVVYVPPGIRQK